jgi:hypothetical protein
MQSYIANMHTTGTQRCNLHRGGVHVSVDLILKDLVHKQSQLARAHLANRSQTLLNELQLVGQLEDRRVGDRVLKVGVLIGVSGERKGKAHAVWIRMGLGSRV